VGGAGGRGCGAGGGVLGIRAIGGVRRGVGEVARSLQSSRGKNFARRNTAGSDAASVGHAENGGKKRNHGKLKIITSVGGGKREVTQKSCKVTESKNVKENKI